MTLFETATRTPLLFRVPWIQASVGARTNTVVELVSLYRTLADLAGIPDAAIESGVQGQNFASVIRNNGAGGDSSWTGSRPAMHRSIDASAVDASPPLREEPPIGFALSQMTRCAKPNASATNSQGYDPCAKTPGMLMEYSYMGYSIRTMEWRFSIWAIWNATTLCPNWSSPANVFELYDHRDDTAAVDFDGTENVNVAGENENAAVVTEMAEHAKAWFGCIH